MKTVDPNEAPEGYVAREYFRGMHSCLDCALNPAGQARHACMKAACRPEDRKDGLDVYFVKKEPPK